MDFSISDYEIVVDSHSPAPPIRPRDELQTVDSSYLRGIVDMGRQVTPCMETEVRQIIPWLLI